MKKHMKRLLLVVICLSLFVSSVPFSVAAEEGIEYLPGLLFGIDFSQEPTEEEKILLEKYYLDDSNVVFSDAYGIQLYQNDCNQINSLPDYQKAQIYYKEYAESNEELNATPNTGALGTYGDILVTYSFSSFGVDFAVVGHAAIVHTNSSKTIESFPATNGHENGVRIYTNNWKTKDKVYGIRVKRAKSIDYTNAAKYAITQADQEKPYNWNFFNKGTTSRFYCSQLVWRAWKNQGFEVDRMNLGNWEPVSPAELVGGSGTYVFYRK